MAPRLPGSGVSDPYPSVVKIVTAANPSSIGTVTIAATGVITVSVAHNLKVGDAFILGTVTSAAPFATGGLYFVQSVPLANTLTASLRPSFVPNYGGNTTAAAIVSASGSATAITKTTVYYLDESTKYSVDGSVRAATVYLPPVAALVAGAVVKTINIGASGTLTVKSLDGSTINGTAGNTGDATQTSQYSTITATFDGTNWLKF